LKIAEVKKLDDGVSGITIEGRIIRVLKPRASQYGWSQFIVIKDDTGEMGSNINIENEEAKYQGGEYIKVKGKISHYLKNNKPNVSLNGNVVDEIVQANEEVSQEKPIVQAPQTIQSVQQEYTNNDYWHDKNLRDIENNKCIVRECAIKAVTEMAVAGVYLDKEGVEQFFKTADEIVDYINNKITSKAITKEFGGKATEVKEETKEKRIAKAQEIANPNMASPAQKNMVEKIIKSRYITKEEVAKIGDLKDLTKINASRYISYWFGNDGEMGERDKRELEAKEKEGNPFITAREPIEKVDKNDNSSLTKDILIEKINKLRKENSLEDDAKFTKELGYNTNFEKWTEKELNKLKEKLEIYKPNWVTD